jgi:hypothetical protein
MPSEVFAWPEGEIWLYPSGGDSALVAYASNVELTKSWDLQEIKLFGGTGTAYVRYVTKGIAVRGTVGQLYHTMALWSMAQSGTGLTLELKHSSVAGNSAGFLAYGVRFPEWRMSMSDGNVGQSTVTMIMPDVSAYGSGI